MNMKITCTKMFPEMPFAHRQHMHAGHCSLIHGHNWRLQVTFEADELDACGFVVDFGKLKFIKADWSELDHALLLNHDDPELGFLRDTLDGTFAKVIAVRDCSSEGLAVEFMRRINAKLQGFEEDEDEDIWEPLEVDSFLEDCRVRNVRASIVTVFEDDKNFASVEVC